MHPVIPRGVRWTVALMLPALAACADDRAPTGPLPSQLPSLAVEDAPDTLIVTNTSGGTDVGSLRWAASQAPFRAIIRFDRSLAAKTIVVDGPVHATQFVFIEGPEDRGVTISGGGRVRVMELDHGAWISNVNIKDGYHPQFGGGIVSSGELALDWAAVYNNRAPEGAAIYGEGQVGFWNSTVAGNDASATGSLVSIGPAGRVILNHATVYGSGPGPVIGTHGDGGTLPVVGFWNAIIAGGGPNCSVGLGFQNWWGVSVSDDASCGNNANIIVADPKLGTLGNNGGPTATIPILKDSPAVNGGQDCIMSTDQRHVARDASCDPGAFEFTDFTRVTITIDPNTKVDATTGRALLTGTLKCTRDDAFRLALELHQDQKVGSDVVDVHSASDIPVSCTTSPKPWSATMVLTDGAAYQAGAARATAQTFDTPQWVAPAGVATAVKISFTRK